MAKKQNNRQPRTAAPKAPVTTPEQQGDTVAGGAAPEDTSGAESAPASSAPAPEAAAPKVQKAKASSAPVKAREASYVTVFANLPHGFEFHLPQGRKLTISGCPVSKLVDVEGNRMSGGKYGETRGVKAEDWEYIKANYGEMAMFKNNLVFAEDDHAYGQARAEDQQELRHGMEQADPNAGATKPLEQPEG